MVGRKGLSNFSMKIRKEERKSREAQAAAENLAAVRGNPSSRDRGVDPSPRSPRRTARLEDHPPPEDRPPTAQQAAEPAQAQPQEPQTPSNQSSSKARTTKKRRNKPNRTTPETRQSREAVRDLRRRLNLIADLGGALER